MKTAFLLFFALLSKYAFSQHTFSICAVDTVTGEVGSAGASCIGSSDTISDIHPGLGVIHTQAAYFYFNQVFARDLMNAGLTPQEIVDSMVASDPAAGALNRQYGVVGIYSGSPQSAAYTGADCISYANHITGDYYAIQGNILLGQQVLDSMEARFLNTEGNLACRLMAAMQGANIAGADTRCLDDSSSSLSSFLRVALPADDPNSPYINLRIKSGPQGYEPIDSLQTLFDQIKSCTEDTTGTGLAPATNNGVKVAYFQNDNSISIHSGGVEAFLFELFDSSGRQIASRALEGRKSHSIKLNHPAKGIYHWRITEDSRTLTGKLFIE